MLGDAHNPSVATPATVTANSDSRMIFSLANTLSRAFLLNCHELKFLRQKYQPFRVSELGQKRTNRRGPKIHLCPLLSESGQTRAQLDCPLCANSGHDCVSPDDIQPSGPK